MNNLIYGTILPLFTDSSRLPELFLYFSFCSVVATLATLRSRFFPWIALLANFLPVIMLIFVLLVRLVHASQSLFSSILWPMVINVFAVIFLSWGIKYRPEMLKTTVAKLIGLVPIVIFCLFTVLIVSLSTL